MNNCAVRFYDNFGLSSKGSEDKATNGIENWSRSNTPMLIDASSRVNSSKYPHKPYIASNYSPWQKFLSLTVWEYLHFYIVVSESEAEKSSQTDDENRF